MAIQKIYIMISFTNSVLGKVIKKYTKDPYVHVSIITTKDASYGYSFGRKKLNNPFIGGFVKENYSEWQSKFPNAYCRVLELEIDDEAYSKLLKIIDHFENNSDKYSYNVLGLFLRAFGKGFAMKNKFFCSQFVSHILNEIDMNIFDKKETLITAGDFEKSSQFKVVYDGSLYEINIPA